jgi:N-acetylneuraminic acid mutarotase
MMLAACALEGILYAIAGSPGDGTGSAMDAYNPATDTWATKASMPGHIDTLYEDDLTPCVVDGNIYVGGYYEQGQIYAYEPKTDSWTKKPSAVHSAMGTIDGRLYYQNNGVFAYDPENDSVTACGPSMPTARVEWASVAVNGRIYVFGGTEDVWSSSRIVAANEVFIPDPSPPLIAQQPAAQTVSASGELTLRVATDDEEEGCTYQWRKDDVDIEGATSATFTLPCVQRFHDGEYSVIVTNEFGSTTSAAATITSRHRR